MARTFEEFFRDEVGITIEDARSRGVRDIDLMQKAFEAGSEAGEEKLEIAVQTAEANIRAEIADGGTSCHWCLETTTRKERERCLAIADKIGFAAVNRTDAQSCCGEIAAKIESGE